MKLLRRQWTSVCMLLMLCSVSNAHESRPGYLQLTVEESGQVAMLFKVPAMGDMRFALYPNLPIECVSEDEPSRYIIDDAYTERDAFVCEGGIAGKTVSIDGLSRTLTDVLVRVEQPDGGTQITKLTPAAPSFVVGESQGVLGVATTYLVIGVEHILLGIDHLLFVLALLVLVDGYRKLFWTITAFTVAHSVTLAVATLGVVQVPQSPVEAIIALSIVFVATEIVHASRGTPGLTQRKPWVVAFSFGLLHGFGFAGALSEVGLPEQAVPVSLLFFNVGVEVGQLVFIAAVLLVTATVRRFLASTPHWAPVAIAYMVGIPAAFWTIERVAGFWS
ncbi:MAG: HupE/UreJ family protein [Woeseiaceae bacterium]